MYTYEYSFKNDSNHERIGLVQAENYNIAIQVIAKIKQLSITDIQNIFDIKQVK